MGYGGLAMIAIFIAFLGLLYCSSAYAEYRDDLAQTTDLSPPEISDLDIWAGNSTMSFSYIISDADHGGSKILRTEVYLLRTPLTGEEPSRNLPLSPRPVDPTSKNEYDVVIPLEDIDGIENTSDDNGSVVIAELKMEQLEKGYIEDNVTIRFSKYFDFTEMPIYSQCKYYMIIVAVDWYGNAYWEIYNVTQYVYSLAGESSKVETKATSPRIWTENLHGKMEYRGIISHYYMLNNRPYVPWIRLDSKLQRCFTLNIATGGHTVEIEEMGVRAGPEVETCGVFVLRCYGLWRYGTLTILVDGEEYMEMVFAYSLGLYGLFTLIILALVAVLFPTRASRRKKGVGEEG